MSEPVEHLGWDATHPDEWRLGATCDECAAHIRSKRAIADGSANAPLWTGLKRLESDRENGQTQRELQKEIFDSARAEGRDIERASRM